MRDLYRFIWKQSGRRQIWLAALSAFVALLAMAPLELQRRIVDDAIEPKNFDLLILFAGLYLAVILIQGGAKYVMRMMRGDIAETAVRAIRQRIFCEVANEEARVAEADDDGEEEGEHRGTAMSIIAAEGEKLGGFVGEGISAPLTDGGMLLAVMGYMLVVDPLVAAVALAIFIPQMIILPKVQNAINRRTEKKTKAVRTLGDSLAEVGEDDEENEALFKKNAGRIKRIHDLQLEKFRLKFLLKFTLNTLNHLSAIAVLAFGGWMVIRGESEVGTIVAFLTGVERLRNPWREMVNFYRTAADARLKYGLINSALGDLNGQR